MPKKKSRDSELHKWTQNPFEEHARLLVEFLDPIVTGVVRNESDTDDMTDLCSTGNRFKKQKFARFDHSDPFFSRGHGFCGLDSTKVSASVLQTDFNRENAPDMFISYIGWCRGVLWVCVKAPDQVMAEQKLLDMISIYGFDEKKVTKISK